MRDAALARLDRHVPVLLGLVLLSLAFHAPPGPSPAGAAIFGGGQDPPQAVWFLNWWSFARAHHLPMMTTDYADYPAGADLAWKTSQLSFALLLGPLIRLFGALGVFNALMGLASPLAGFATYLAARELTRQVIPAIAAGLLFAVMPYQAGQNIGHLNLCFSAPVPLCLFVILRAYHRSWPSWRLACVLGLLLALEFGISQEVFASLFIFAALLCVLVWRSPARAALCALAPGVAWGIVLCVLLIATMLWQMLLCYDADVGQIAEPIDFSADLLGFVIPSQLVWLGGQTAHVITGHFTGNYTEQMAYLGLPFIVLLIVIGRQRGTPRIAVLMVGFAALLSLGPFLHIAGQVLSTAPWLLLYHAPFTHQMLPARFALFMDLATAFAAALWLARPGVWRLPVLALCALPLLPAQQADRAWTHLAVPPAIAALPAGAHITILPLFGQEMGLQYLDLMRFKLVAQGYLGTGLAPPFASWPLYPALWNNDFAAVDPAQFASFLATYGAQYIAVLPGGYGADGRGDGDAAAAAAARTLVLNAGWRAATVTPQAIIYTRAGPPLARTSPTPPPAEGETETQRLHRRTVILTLVALLSALAVWADARLRARRPDAALWLVAVFFAWLVALPAYLFIRLSRASSSRA